MAFLLPMVVLTIISVVFGADWMGATGNFWDDLWDGFVEFCKWLGRLQGEEVPNGGPEEGTPTSVPDDVFFNIDPIFGAIAIITIIGILAIAIGIKVVGSGLSEWSIRTAILVVAYVGLWTVLTILSMPLIKTIEIFGGIIYVSLTLGYTIGVIQKIAEG